MFSVHGTDVNLTPVLNTITLAGLFTVELCAVNNLTGKRACSALQSSSVLSRPNPI